MKNIQLEFETVSEPKRAQKQTATARSSTSIFAFLAYDQVVEVDEFGEPRLKAWRQKQLVQALSEFQAAQQYVLAAKKNKIYPCLKCPKPDIFLKRGEVWRYGATKKGETGRYGNTYLLENDLEYIAQLDGTWQACLMEEKMKIFNYPLLPENQRRPLQQRLAMPPGNLRTD